jgi:hypothetical protein
VTERPRGEEDHSQHYCRRCYRNLEVEPREASVLTVHSPIRGAQSQYFDYPNGPSHTSTVRSGVVAG